MLDENRVRRAFALALEKKPRGCIGILSRLQRLVEMDREQHTARVESATPLSDDLQADVANRIREIYGAGVDISFSQNPALIGGLRIQIGSDLYDGSVKTRLEKLEQSF